MTKDTTTTTATRRSRTSTSTTTTAFLSSFLVLVVVVVVLVLLQVLVVEHCAAFTFFSTGHVHLHGHLHRHLHGRLHKLDHCIKVLVAKNHEESTSNNNCNPTSSTRGNNESDQHNNIINNSNTKNIKRQLSAHLNHSSSSTDCDDINTPPSLTNILRSIHSIKSGSDIRGTFVDHSRVGSILNVSSAIIAASASPSASPSASASIPAQGSRVLTPFAAYCYGAAFAKMVQIRAGKGMAVQRQSTSTASLLLANDLFPTATAYTSTSTSNNDNYYYSNNNIETETTNICVGRDPRNSGTRLADAFCRGVESVDGVKAHYTNLASTPSMFAFCRSHLLDCDGGVMVTASHLPMDRNGFKFFTSSGGLIQKDIDILAESACAIARSWFDVGIIPQSSGYGAVYCSDFVDYMPVYMDSLRNAIYKEVRGVVGEEEDVRLPLEGLRIVLNAGNGAGYFFNKVLDECGADVSNSIHLVPDGSFPKRTGVPNPEYQPMMDETIEACEKCNADIGIMLDTDADRCGFVVPQRSSGDTDSTRRTRTYQALNRNRLIALLGVIFSSTSPGCTFVTDSVTSEGLSIFLTEHLGINHVRYLKGYANVIGKAKDLTESGQALAEVAIETSGHCAMRENGYLDDGTYTAVKVVSLLAGIMKNVEDDEKPDVSLFNLISELEELEEVYEFRMEVLDGSIHTTREIFKSLLLLLEATCIERNDWDLDEENLEGIRIRIGENGFFMLRMSLHDPLLSLMVEAKDKQTVQSAVLTPILEVVRNNLKSTDLDVKVLEEYLS